ncbi:fructose-1,6-bisphosphatase I [Rhodobium orientis]|uniref:Fructose-1,6-bisphosphatase class 1 n=1 Tax=Rhodobium orientis TaxID=34017 RepID=A0A327JGS5_9HYPH|nr:class 1 fructose-bisphosphatase [Rhodobium orientis]MBB4303075.1 fructose-1,6-bisphosphatase I [Rhodobium orientis]MBK5948294.1 fructose-bisphosphatase class I [Rhodobium orientis]RAI25131.1 fructose-bisphosphatase class I [Rhodobium orientis]
MTTFIGLEEHLKTWAGADETRRGIAQTIVSIAGNGIAIAELIAAGPLAGTLGASLGENADGDTQKELDVRAHEMIAAGLKETPVAYMGSEEAEEPVAINPDTGTLVVAIDPLDGSSNIDTNVSVGTIFSILPVQPGSDRTPLGDFLQPGTAQLAAGIIVYGPQTSLVLTVGAGTQIYILDRANRRFLLVREKVEIPLDKPEYAINASNYRFWDEPVRAYIDDCIAGEEGPRATNFNMRWIASLVAEVYRILARGGIFLYPRDSRKGYQRGRLRLVYEANPVAFIVEQAGGGATDGTARIMELKPGELHERVPLIFGARPKIERVIRYHTEPHSFVDRAPLFGKRGLFRM